VCCSLYNAGHDDPDIKYDKLKSVVEIFCAKKGRDPAFWLDKVPVFIHSFRKIARGNEEPHSVWALATRAS